MRNFYDSLECKFTNKTEHNLVMFSVHALEPHFKIMKKIKASGDINSPDKIIINEKFGMKSLMGV